MFGSQNTISAKEGRFFLAGVEMLNNIKLELTVEKEKVEIKRMGKRMTGHKTVGLSAAGTVTEYHATSNIGLLLQKYKDTGEDVYMDGTIVVEDKASGRGTERIALIGINFDSATIANLDAEGDVIKDELPFTIEDFNYISLLDSGF
ncbi:phage tail tube protein [Sporomusa sp.]|uniref:phage tail tube protein n=1 Tax=Sporomusa sp. TaxID=2078658 RepID=UPI002C56D9E1|nr:phage tail tube protein [Sporomusa sp.]HWR07099.1 phage tail tube protein [Sporomusa sp.]